MHVPRQNIFAHVPMRLDVSVQKADLAKAPIVLEAR